MSDEQKQKTELFKRAAKQIAMPGFRMCPKTGWFVATSPSVRKLQKDLLKTKEDLLEKHKELDEKLALVNKHLKLTQPKQKDKA